jgi:hypothetical protein
MKKIFKSIFYLLFKGDGKWHKVFKISNPKEEAQEIITQYIKQAK